MEWTEESIQGQITARAGVISRASAGLRKILPEIERIEAGLSADELDKLSIIVLQDSIIRRYREQHKPKLYIVRKEEPIG